MRFEITRKIEIDAGHRILEHGSKCRYLHGHRYVVHAIVSGQLAEEGQEKGMVLDFGFLKEVLIDHIERPCDHGLILEAIDPLIVDLLSDAVIDRDYIEAQVAKDGYFSFEKWDTKLYIIGMTPTAENLAKHWFDRVVKDVSHMTNDRARLEGVRVHETPNCFAEYRPV